MKQYCVIVTFDQGSDTFVHRIDAETDAEAIFAARDLLRYAACAWKTVTVCDEEGDVVWTSES